MLCCVCSAYVVKFTKIHSSITYPEQREQHNKSTHRAVSGDGGWWNGEVRSSMNIPWPEILIFKRDSRHEKHLKKCMKMFINKLTGIIMSKSPSPITIDIPLGFVMQCDTVWQRDQSPSLELLLHLELLTKWVCVTIYAVFLLRLNKVKWTWWEDGNTHGLIAVLIEVIQHQSFSSTGFFYSI